MIEYDDKLKQDFLDTQWIKWIQEAGIDMSDSGYLLVETLDGKKYLARRDEKDLPEEVIILPTYSFSEIFYKLDEWPKDSDGGLRFCKDAPFYIWYYKFKSEKGSVEGIGECPLHGAARLLILSANDPDIDYVKDISKKKV